MGNNSPILQVRDLVKTCVDNASCIFGNGHQFKRIEDFNAFIKVKRKDIILKNTSPLQKLHCLKRENFLAFA